MTQNAQIPALPLDLGLAAQLPENVLFGTSSWNYPGWKGLIYHDEYKSEKELTERSLTEYSQCPLFRTVGIDSTFYGPPRPKTLERYASQVPQGFKWVSKVWEQITIPRFAKHPRYGTKAGEDNEWFLSAELFRDKVLPPYVDAGVLEHTGPFVFQFQHIPFTGSADADEFLNLLFTFLKELPREFEYAIELRNPELLTPKYFAILNEYQATHCFNHWTDMPPLGDQMKAAAAGGGISAPFFLSRILTPLGVKYEHAVKRFSPYGEIKLPNEQMRRDVVRMVRRAIERNVKVYVLVNNRSEGCAPQTIAAIGKMILKDSGIATS